MVSRVSRVSILSGGQSMKNNEKIRLCGGTFFTLFLQARKPRMGVREHYIGEKDGLSEPEVLISLSKVVVQDLPEPNQSMKPTFKGNTSDYKSCKGFGGTYLPFKDNAAIDAFDKRIKEDYESSLIEMEKVVSEFIDVRGSTKKDERLVKALIEAISCDDSIEDEQLFFVFENGSAITKAQLINTSNICLQSFLLGIWHFVVVNRKDNKVGKDTYDIWCPPNNGAERNFKAVLGESISNKIKLAYSNTVVHEVEVEIVEETSSDDRESKRESTNANQTVNNPVVFNQYGNNNMQIANVGVLNINKG